MGTLSVEIIIKILRAHDVVYTLISENINLDEK